MKENFSKKEFITIEELEKYSLNYVTDQVEKCKRYTNNCKQLEYLAGIMFELSDCKQFVRDIATNSTLVMMQPDEELKEWGCQLFTASHAVGVDNYEFVFTDYGVEVRIRPFKK